MVSASHAVVADDAQRAQRDGGGHDELPAPAVDDRVDGLRAGADAERGVGEVRGQREQEHPSRERGGAPPAVPELLRVREQACERLKDAIHQSG